MSEGCKGQAVSLWKSLEGILRASFSPTSTSLSRNPHLTPCWFLTSVIQYWCTTCWPLARTCINCSCLCSCGGQEGHAVVYLVSSASSHCSEWLFLVSAQKHSLHSCYCKEYLSVQVLWKQKAWQGFVLDPEIIFWGEQGEAMLLCVHMLPSHCSWALCIQIAVSCAQAASWGCCVLCVMFLLSYPDVWNFPSLPLLSRQHWHWVLTAWLGLGGKLPAAGRGGAFALGLWY